MEKKKLKDSEWNIQFLMTTSRLKMATWNEEVLIGHFNNDHYHR